MARAPRPLARAALGAAVAIAVWVAPRGVHAQDVPSLPDWAVPAKLGRTMKVLEEECRDKDAAACHDLALLFLGGNRIIPIDPARGHALASEACEGGSPAGCALLGWCLHEGVGDEVSVTVSMLVYEQACDGGHAGGCYHLGLARARGEGLAQVAPARAAEAFRKACTLGYQRACSASPGEVAGGADPAPAVATTPAGGTARAQRLMPRCDAGEVDACLEAGLLYAWGDDPARDHVPAERALGRACDRGVLQGCFHLGLLYQRAESWSGAAQADPRVVPLYQRACDGGVHAACAWLGEAYYAGHGVAQDQVMAYRLMQRSCDGGDARGCGNLGYVLLEGKGAAADRPRGVKLLDTACQRGIWFACYREGIALVQAEGVTRDTPRGVSLLQQACDKENSEACHQLGRLYLKGVEVPLDTTRALELLGRGCKLGDQNACKDRDGQQRTGDWD